MLGTGMNARKLGAICALLAATLNLIGCESSRDSPDRQFQKQVKRAQECHELQDKLVGDRPLTPERAEEITKTMDRTGCIARLMAQHFRLVSLVLGRGQRAHISLPKGSGEDALTHLTNLTFFPIEPLRIFLGCSC